MMIFGQELKKVRVEYGFSQQEIAEKLYISRQTISKWENGVSYPDIDKLIAISSLFNISIDYLLGNDVKLKESVLMKNKFYELCKTILKYGSILIVFILIFLGFNAWANQETEMKVTDLKINNTFFEKHQGHRVLNVYGKLTPVFSSYEGGAFNYFTVGGTGYSFKSGTKEVAIYGQMTHSPFGSKQVVFEIPEDKYHGIDFSKKDVYLLDKTGKKVKLYDHKTKTQPYSIDQKDSQKILNQMTHYKDLEYGEKPKK